MIASIRNNPDPALPRTLAPEAVQDERANVRAELFQHLARLVLVPTNERAIEPGSPSSA
jgi:hypothetical protein